MPQIVAGSALAGAGRRRRSLKTPRWSTSSQRPSCLARCLSLNTAQQLGPLRAWRSSLPSPPRALVQLRLRAGAGQTDTVHEDAYAVDPEPDQDVDQDLGLG